MVNHNRTPKAWLYSEASTFQTLHLNLWNCQMNIKKFSYLKLVFKVSALESRNFPCRPYNKQVSKALKQALRDIPQVKFELFTI